jgi:hypothetical protein
MNQSLLKDVLTYLKNPIYKENIERRPFFTSLLQIIRINLLSVLLSFGVGVIITFIATKTNALNDHAVGDFIENESIFASFMFACVVAPLLEESAFRLWLINKPLQVAIGLFGFLFYYISSFIPGSLIKPLIKSQGYDNPIIVVAIYSAIFLVGVTFFYSIVKLKDVQEKLTWLYKNKYKWLFFGSAFLFGFLHITNYQFSWTVVFVTPILILPQVFGGILLSYIRVTYGFWRGVLGHFIYNSLLLAPLLGIKLISGESRKILQSQNFDLALLNQYDKIVVLLVIAYFLFLVCAVIGSNIHLLVIYFIRKNKAQ